MFDHFWKKILSVFIAFVIWGMFSLSQIKTILEDTLPLQYKNIPDNMIVLDSPNQVSYSITSASKHANINPNIHFFVSLKDIKEGKHILPVEYTLDSRLPEYAKVRLETPFVKVVIDKKILKDVNIVPDFTYLSEKDKNDYLLSDISINPKSTLVSVPKTFLENIKVIKTAPILINKPGLYHFKEKLIVPNSKITFHDSNVEIEFLVQENWITKTFSVPVNTTGLSHSFYIKKMNFSELSLKISGLKSNIKNLINLQNIIVIHLEDINKAGHYKFSIHPNLFENLTLISPKTLPQIDIFIAKQDNLEESEKLPSSSPKEEEFKESSLNDGSKKSSSVSESDHFSPSNDLNDNLEEKSSLQPVSKKSGIQDNVVNKNY